eukprot:scaffold1169_cov367-Prasinococcus_capsulatus_cf.AAC.19
MGHVPGAGMPPHSKVVPEYWLVRVRMQTCTLLKPKSMTDWPCGDGLPEYIGNLSLRQPTSAGFRFSQNP